MRTLAGRIHRGPHRRSGRDGPALGGPLDNGGREGKCAWLTDRFGVSWHIVPDALPRLLGADDREAAGRAKQAMVPMTKIDITALETAFRGQTVLPTRFGASVGGALFLDVVRRLRVTSSMFAGRSVETSRAEVEIGEHVTNWALAHPGLLMHGSACASRIGDRIVGPSWRTGGQSLATAEAGERVEAVLSLPDRKVSRWGGLPASSGVSRLHRETPTPTCGDRLCSAPACAGPRARRRRAAAEVPSHTALVAAFYRALADGVATVVGIGSDFDERVTGFFRLAVARSIAR